MDDSDLLDWIPISIWWEPSGAAVQWFHPGDNRFIEPFFEQTVQAMIERSRATRSRLHVTPAETLIDLQTRFPAPPPSGFIFHASRCGSTLLAQVLAAVPRNRVLSEPAVVDAILREARTRADASEGNIRLLRGIISALCRRHRGEESAFLKFTSRAMSEPDLPLIRSAYPDVPWVFLYREPREILASLLRSTAAMSERVHRLPPGLASAGLIPGDPEGLARMPPGEFWTRVLAARFSAALHFYDPDKTLLLNYRQLPHAAWERLPRFFNCADAPEEAYSAGDLDNMRRAAEREAKAPSREFKSRAGRRDMGADLVPREVESLVMPLYERLESLRRATMRKT